MINITIKVEGDVQVERFIRKLEKKLSQNLARGMAFYVKRHLVPRMKARLSRASERKTSSKGAKGLISKSGGYGTPKNEQDYADWKASKSNLPEVGSLGTRELVATGHLVDSISVIKMQSAVDNMLFEVGHREYDRPKTFPFKNQKGAPQYADLNTTVSNIEVAQLVEEGRYKFWVKEFDDVRREIAPYVTGLIRETIKQLMKEYGGKVTL